MGQTEVLSEGIQWLTEIEVRNDVGDGWIDRNTGSENEVAGSEISLSICSSCKDCDSAQGSGEAFESHRVRGCVANDGEVLCSPRPEVSSFIPFY